MGTFFIVLGVLCIIAFFVAVQTPIYIILGVGCIIYGIYHKKEVTTKPEPSGGDTGPYTGRIHGDTYMGVYDSDGNFIKVDGSFTEGLDGRFRDNDGHVVEKDSDGENHLL